MKIRAALFVLGFFAVSAFAAPPSAKEILESVRMRQAQQQLDLKGHLREGPAIIPFRLTQSGPVIRYTFSKPDEALQLRLADNESHPEEVTRQAVEPAPPEQS